MGDERHPACRELSVAHRYLRFAVAPKETAKTLGENQQKPVVLDATEKTRVVLKNQKMSFRLPILPATLS
jgi:hypothetical protein